MRSTKQATTTSVRPMSARLLAIAAAATALALLAARPLHAQAYGNQQGSPQQYVGAQSPDQPYDDPNQQQVDPPSRVGRLALMQGDVSFQAAGVQDFSAAELNYPLTSGDRVYTGDNARAEVQAGQIVARLTQRTDFTVTSLTDDFAQFGLAQGSVHLRTYAFDPSAPTEIATPIASVTLLSAGDVRVDVFPQDGSTVVTVFSGQVQVTGDGVDQTVQSGQSLELSGNAPTRAQLVRRARPDALDQFSAQRDSQYQQQFASNQQYVNPDTVGYSDLGQYGDWGDGGDYGPIWYPRDVAGDWAPYRVGHWAYIRPWGYTWVEAEPWGFAPFHYGRWVQNRGRWGWIPGSPVVRPVYSPALVAFVGGGGFSLSIGIGGGGGVAAWFPLGPREVYQPWYRTSPVYVNRVNVTNIYNRNTVEVRNIYNSRTNVYVNNRTNVYVNRTAAITAVPQRSFETGRPVRNDALRLDPHQFDRAPIMARPSAPPPDRGFNRPSPGAAPPRALPPVEARPVLADRPNTNGPQGPRGGFRRGNDNSSYQGGGANQAPNQTPGQGGYTAPNANQPGSPVSRPGNPAYPGNGRPNQPQSNQQPAQTQTAPAAAQPQPAQTTQPSRDNGNRNGLGNGDRNGYNRNPSQPSAPATTTTQPQTQPQNAPPANPDQSDPVMRNGPRTLPPGVNVRDNDQQQQQLRDQQRQQQDQQRQQGIQQQQQQQIQQQQLRDQQQRQQQEQQRQQQATQQQQQQQARDQAQRQQEEQQKQQQLVQQQQQQQQAREQQQRQQQDQQHQQQQEQQRQQQQAQQQQREQQRQQQQPRPQPEQPRPHADPPPRPEQKEHPVSNPQ